MDCIERAKTPAVQLKQAELLSPPLSVASPNRRLNVAPRSFWKGYLKLSLVTCPVTLQPATGDSERVRFRMLSRKTLRPLESRYVDSGDGKPVPLEDQVKGYQIDNDNFVMLEPEELTAVALESTRTIEIENFIPRDSIGWIWYDKPHFLAPQDAVGDEAFVVIREAMEKNSVAGIARVVLYRRERPVMIEQMGKGMVLWTLRYASEIREQPKDWIDQPVDTDAAKALKTFIRRNTHDWDPALARDEVQEKYLELIADKKPGKPSRKRSSSRTRDSNVVDLMERLRQSLGR